MPTDEANKITFSHLLPGEIPVWRAFLRIYQNDYDRFEYDVHLGEGSLPQEAPQNIFTENFRYLTLKRADAVGFKGSLPTIFEIRSKASLPLMGQLQGYRFLWMRSRPDSAPPSLVMICNFMQPDDVDVFEAHDISVVILPFEAR